MSVDERDYQDAKERAVQALVEMLKVGDEIGKPQEMMAAEFMGTFAQAAQEALAP